ncbi:MAG: hypothetical protein K2K57_14185 [Oscillospiraceae bacterium]|nr:hypothetical protein [Oscillospiraceae bacterium]
MEKEVKKLHPFNVMDQMIAHSLAMEGFEIINVIPSNKYAEAVYSFSYTFYPIYVDYYNFLVYN